MSMENSPRDPLLVLGSRVTHGHPGAMLRSRLDKTLELYSGQMVIVSGRGEAGAMAEYLIQRGVDPRDVLVEPVATSTNENLENAHSLAPDAVLQVVTNDFHALRTALWAWHLGIAITVHSARTPWLSMPRNYLRELAATPHSAARILWRRLRR